MVNRRHPLGVALGQVVVHRDDVHVPPGQVHEVGRQGRHERLALPRGHLGDLALEQHVAADELDVEVAHLDGPAGHLSHDRERFRQDLFRTPAGRQSGLELGRLGLQRRVVELAHPILERPGPLDHTRVALDQTLVPGAEDLQEDLAYFLESHFANSILSIKAPSPLSDTDRRLMRFNS